MAVGVSSADWLREPEVQDLWTHAQAMPGDQAEKADEQHQLR